MKVDMKAILQVKFPHNWQWKSNASGHSLLILLALAQYGKRKFSKVYFTGTAVDLSKLTGLTPRTAQRAIKDLISQSIVEKVNDNMSLGRNIFTVEPATICRSVDKLSDNMSSNNLSPNEIDSIDNIDTIDIIYNSNPLSIEQTEFIKKKFKNVDLELEIEKFTDYWSEKEKPTTWSGYRRLLTWLDKAERNNNAQFNQKGFSKGRETAVSKEIDEHTRRFAEQQRIKSGQ
mgnify:CR=1 FL=1|tara:strand:+ start:1614 stop:2306 length:693 start_codon:yes stop_codon:yes gene_type:complete